MNSEKLIILGVLVKDRSANPRLLQEIFSKYGCCIKTRLGINEVDLPNHGDAGLILLELMGDEDDCLRLENEIDSLQGIEIKKMVF